MNGPRPLEIRLKTAERALVISFDDGSEFLLTAEYLRVESPSAVEHSPRKRWQRCGTEAASPSPLISH